MVASKVLTKPCSLSSLFQYKEQSYLLVNIQNKEEEKKTPGPATVRQ
jgi:hypothetical protein